MRNRVSILSVLGIILITFGCQQTPMSPEMTQGDSGSILGGGTTKKPYTSTLDMNVPGTVDPGRVWITDGIIHTRNQIIIGTMTGDIEGRVTVTHNANLNSATDTGTAWGTFIIGTDRGDWKGTYQGKFVEGLFTLKSVGKGTDRLKGMHIRSTHVETGPTTDIYTTTGHIINPGGKTVGGNLVHE
jgi:hypothetical protein